jgi:hypothetical protein
VRAQPIFEHDEPMIFLVGSAKIELVKALPAGLLDGTPKQHLHSTQTEESLVSATVLIYESILEMQRKDTGDGDATSGSNPDTELVTHAAHQI